MAKTLRRITALILALNLYATVSASNRVQTEFSPAQPPWFRNVLAVGRSKPVLAAALINRIDGSPSVSKVSLPCWHVVRRGESVSSIADRLGTLPQTIIRVNSLKNPDHVLVGQRLYVTRPKPDDVSTLTIKTGDTLSGLARRCGLTVATLCRLNGIRDSDRLLAGQKILIPKTITYPQARTSRSIRELRVTLAFSWPVAGTITSHFGWRNGRMHNGIDVAAPAGTPVKAAAPGEVEFAGWYGGYGLLVILDHGQGWKTYYAHNSLLIAAPGQHVERGQVLAEVGSTGQATGNHLHFEIRNGSMRVNPISKLPHS